jgi:hypothetical protein
LPRPARNAVVAAALLLTAACAGRADSAGGPTGGTGATAGPAPTPARPDGAWAPSPGRPWQWQLTGTVDLSVDVPVYDVDGQATPAAVVAALHRRGRRAVCYVSVGSWERWRPDAGAFPPTVIGRALDGFPDESWLDIRRLDALAGPLGRRFDLCRAKGFDAVEPDNVDGYQNDSGFRLTAADQLRFNRWVAGAAHARGMGVALKNDADQVADLAGAFDFAVVEECQVYGECDAYRPFVEAGKAVLHVEYTDTWPAGRGCAVAGFSSMRKHRDLDAWRRPC